MEQYIKKSAVVAEIEELYKGEIDTYTRNILGRLKSNIDTLEVKEVDSWHFQSKEDIDNVLEDWGLHTFVCLMKDGTIQKFSGIQAECYNGTINKHLDCVDDNYEWDYNDIVCWIEIPIIKAQKGE